jgi:hypothetical protein
MTINNDQLLRLAAYCADLQRQRGPGHLIKIPVHKVQRLLNLQSFRQAMHLLAILEDEGILQCVKRGSGHTPQQQGYPSLWRYKAPL